MNMFKFWTCATVLCVATQLFGAGKFMQNTPQVVGIKAVLFDLDGTVANNEEAYKESYRLGLADLGARAPTKAELDELYSVCTSGEMFVATRAIKLFALTQTSEEILKIFKKHMIALMPTILKLTKGFERFHAQLEAAGIKSCIATGGPRDNLDGTTKILNLDKYFGDRRYCREDAGHKLKPDPAIFLYAAKQLGVTPEECLVFEDSPPGFGAAKAAGMRCIGLHNNLNKGIGNVAAFVDSFDEALDAIIQLSPEFVPEKPGTTPPVPSP
jgi:HAD superfamily hydrolase (TIGR01509 family)